MKFRLNEKLTTEYEGWSQEDIDLYESIDWDEVGDEDYDAGCAYLDSAVLYADDSVDRIETEFHKFFKHDPTVQPYYMPVDKNPFEQVNCKRPYTTGEIHKDYKIYNLYNKNN